MSYYSNEQHKKEIYKRWLEQGRPWFDIDPKKEPTYAEKQIILEMLERENTRAKYHKGIEQSKKRFDKLYEENTGKISRDIPKTKSDLPT